MVNAMQASPRPYPSAEASNVLDLPLAESDPSCARWTPVLATSIRFDPAATAAAVSPLCSPLCARWTATKDDEQAVSIPTQGPCSPKV